MRYIIASVLLLLLITNGSLSSNIFANESTAKEKIPKEPPVQDEDDLSLSTVSSKILDSVVGEKKKFNTNADSSPSSIIYSSSSDNISDSSSSSSRSNSTNFSNNVLSIHEDFVPSNISEIIDEKEIFLISESPETSALTSTFIPLTTVENNHTQTIDNSSNSLSNSPASYDYTAFEGNDVETTTTIYNFNSTKSLDYITSLSNVTTVRKCCDISQFFSLVTSACEPSENNKTFQISIFTLLENKNKDISYQTGTLKGCPETNEPPSIISDITNSTYSVLSSGEVLDKTSQYSFDQAHYCLELVGAEVEDAALTLAYCLNNDYHFDYYDYHLEHELEPLRTVDTYKHIVRKCCGEDEFYSTAVHKCISTNAIHVFPYEVQKITFESNDIDFSIISSRIHECPDISIKPKIIPVDEDEYRLLHTGELIEVQNGHYHNYSHYCLEMVGTNESELTLTLALCSKSTEIPKCCPSGKYFDDVHLDCLSIPANVNHSNILMEFNTDSEPYSHVPIGHFLRCQNTFPVQDEAQNLFVKEGKLCNNIACFDKEDYCIDYIGKDRKELKASAFYCQKEYFVKCCKAGNILSIKGCTEYDDGKSVLLEHLTNTRTFVNSFDTKNCRKNKGILLDQTLAAYVIWWVSNDGSYLTVSAEPNKKIVHNYCVDDFIDSDGHVGPGAYVCESDVSHLLPNEHHFLRYSKKGSLGKCCPENVKDGYVFYYSGESHNCEIVPHNESLRDNILLSEATFNEEHFHDFPECPTKKTGYHSFPFEPGNYDHAKISSKGVLTIISKDGKCILREDTVEDRDYCIEYVLTEDGELKPSAFLCAYAPETKVFEEKYIYITVCLSISCLCLLFTLIYLFTITVKRGFVTVRKVSTLAGRILVSYVSSNFLGFAAFSLTQHENSLNKADTIGCYILAGFVQFFNLATFCWNTSICLESLLLTIDISISKCVRYLLHSLWAWGFPFAITLIMFVMDAYREDLPCGTITPKIGVSYCFHSDNDSKLVYFYIPILFTLIANLAFIFGAKAMRKSRLKRLEKGQKTPASSGGGNRKEKTTAEGGTQTANSGMRTHQNLNTKTESVRIVLWTGTTWFSELAGFVFTRYIINQSNNEEWYNYLWYIPTSINALRGVGIFGIIVLLPEKRKIQSFFKRTKIRFRKLYKAFKESAGVEDSDSNFRSSTQKSSFADTRRRNMSVTTMISTLSSSIYNSSHFFSKSETNSLRKASIGSYLSSKWDSLRKTSSHNFSNVNNNNNKEHSVRKKLSVSSSAQNGQSKPIRKYGMIRSVSQIDRRASNSSGNSFVEELEMDENYGKRKCSIPLPKLQEEESYMEREENIVNPPEESKKSSCASKNILIKKSHSDSNIHCNIQIKKENSSNDINDKVNCEESCSEDIYSTSIMMLATHNRNFNKSLSENNLSKNYVNQNEKPSEFSYENNEESNLDEESNTSNENSLKNGTELEESSSDTLSESRDSEYSGENINSQTEIIANCPENHVKHSLEEEILENFPFRNEECIQSPVVERATKPKTSDTKKTSIELEQDTLIRCNSDGTYEVYHESTA